MSSRSGRTGGSSSGKKSSSSSGGHSRGSSSGSSAGSRTSGNDWRADPRCDYCHGGGSYEKLGPYVKDYKCGSCFGLGYFTGSGGVKRNCPGCAGRGYIPKEVVGYHRVMCDCAGYY